MISGLETQMWMLGDVAVAAVLSGIVGFERERAAKPAGFRTHMIVGAASALLVSLGKILIINYEATTSPEILRVDPIRIIEAIVVGVSFIGAGTILKMEKKNNILFLTTAATLLFSAGIGICVALSQYYLAAGVTILALLVNHIIRYLDQKISGNKKWD